MKKNRISVAEFLTQQIAISGVSQKEIAERLNYEKPNIITMFKQGKTKVPLNKIAPLAKILGIDPVHFLRLAMLEYSPETWEVLESMIGQRMVSDSEQHILDIMRSATANYEVPLTPMREVELATLFGGWAQHEYRVGKAAVEAANKRKTKEVEATEPTPEPVFGLPSQPTTEND